MGGNTSITTKTGEMLDPERIPLAEIGRAKFVKLIQQFVMGLNKEFYRHNNYYIWEDNKEIMNGGIFNGSTSFIMSPDYSDAEVEKYKKSAGDVDLAFNSSYAKDVYNYLEDHEGVEFAPGAKYLGNNRNSEDALGNTIICLVKLKFGNTIVQAQIDFELSEFVDGDEMHGYIDSDGIIYDSDKNKISSKNNVEIIRNGW
jgi:hypothetical protein